MLPIPNPVPSEAPSGLTAGWHHLTIRSTGEASPVLDQVAAAMAGVGYPSKDLFDMRRALEEALVNAVRHGNRGDPAKRVHVRYCVTAGRVFAEVEDEGAGFDPDRVPGERGLLLMRSYLTWCCHNGRGNRVTLYKHRSSDL